MKKKKKGTLKAAVMIIVLIFVGFLIIAISLGLFGKTKEKVDENIDIPGGPEELSKKGSEVDPKIEDSFNKFAEILEQSKGENCLVEHNDLPKEIKEGHLFLARLNDNTYMQLFDKQLVLVFDATIPKIPCVVNAKNFYNNCLKGTDCKNKDNIMEVEVKIKNKNILFDGVEAELKDQNVMFQFDDKHVCFFPTKDGGFVGTGLFVGCEAYDNKLNDKCLKYIKNKIESCK